MKEAHLRRVEGCKLLPALPRERLATSAHVCICGDSKTSNMFRASGSDAGGSFLSWRKSRMSKTHVAIPVFPVQIRALSSTARISVKRKSALPPILNLLSLRCLIHRQTDRADTSLPPQRSWSWGKVSNRSWKAASFIALFVTGRQLSVLTWLSCHAVQLDRMTPTERKWSLYISTTP